MDFDEKLLEFSDSVLSKSLNDQEKNNYTETIFESIKHINKYGQEFWFARELSKIPEYKDYRNFLIAIDKAMETCKQSGNEIKEHFGEATNMILIGNGAHREVGANVRQTIKELGGTMPEDLPTPSKSIKQIEREHSKKELN